MRFKRILCALLALLMVASFAACSNDVGELPPDNIAAKPTTPDATENSGPRKLIFQEFGIPVVEPFVYYHETLNNINHMFITTCFDFDAIDMYAAVQNSSFFGESGRNLQMHIGEESMYYHPDFPMYDFFNGVSCEVGGTEENPDMIISIDSVTQTAYFTTPNAIRLIIEYNPEVEGYLGMIQDYPHEILTTLLGWEFADFVVYAKDSDGLDYYKDESILPHNLSDNADAGNGGYTFLRTFEENKVTYEIFFYEGMALSDEVLLGRPVENATYNTLPYKLDSVLSENFGGVDPADIHTFGNKIFTPINPEYENVLVSSIYHNKTIDSNNVFYDVGCLVEIPDTDTYLDFLTTYTISEGQLITSDVALYLSINRMVDISEMTDNKLVENTTQTEINRLLSIAQSILPDVKFTKIDTQDLSYKYQIEYTLFGESVSKTCEVFTTLNTVELSIDLNNGPEHNHDHNH